MDESLIELLWNRAGSTCAEPCYSFSSPNARPEHPLPFYQLQRHSLLADRSSLLLPPQDAIQGVGGLVDQRLRVVREGVEILECQITAIADLVDCLQHRRPVGRAVHQRAEVNPPPLTPYAPVEIRST